MEENDWNLAFHGPQFGAGSWGGGGFLQTTSSMSCLRQLPKSKAKHVDAPWWLANVQHLNKAAQCQKIGYGPN